MGRARRFLAETLQRWEADGFEWVGVQLISELATNVVLHARTPFTVLVRLDHGLLRLEVSDRSERPPVRKHYEVSATTGRGMALVDRLSVRWGVEADGDGKTVWCEVPPVTGGGYEIGLGAAEAIGLVNDTAPPPEGRSRDNRSPRNLVAAA